MMNSENCNFPIERSQQPIYLSKLQSREKLVSQSTNVQFKNPKSKSFQTNTQQFPIPKGKFQNTKREFIPGKSPKKKLGLLFLQRTRLEQANYSLLDRRYLCGHIALEQCLASYRTTFKDMQRSLKRKSSKRRHLPESVCQKLRRSHSFSYRFNREAIFETFPRH
ncbi:hypothetical protein CEXT_758801 [Caerostris extrusa]|uniref:Ribosomal protein S4 n=1 Tax=Caerostris extrusa TaxID=172846 RepID=A0AAV4U5U8_CAEEX|nr:hypothetical protein CEXT_758801 [Caerostris extrusa]